MTDKQFTTETRIVCASFGDMGHHNHLWVKDEGLALRYRDKLTKDIVNKAAAVLELPYKVETRQVSDWQTVEVVEVVEE